MEISYETKFIWKLNILAARKFEILDEIYNREKIRTMYASFLYKKLFEF